MIKFDLKHLSKEQKDNRRRIIEVSHKLNLSHIGSCLSTIDLIDAVYKVKSRNEKFVLSNGHAGIAWYVILEKHNFFKDSETIEKLHIHPDRNTELGIDLSSGSLGQGLPVALGMAMANRSLNVYCAISDGECAEGSIWESLRISQEYNVSNLKILINANGWGGYGTISIGDLFKRLKGFGCRIQKINGHNTTQIIKSLKAKGTGPTIIFAQTEASQFSFLKGQGAHYYTMKEADYQKAISLLKI